MPLPRGEPVPMNEQPANDIRLSVVIPTYNKAPRIAATLDAVASYLSKKPFASEIVVVDDGSSDGTADAARAALASFAGRHRVPGHPQGDEPGQGRLGPRGRPGLGRRDRAVHRRRPVDAHRGMRQAPGRARGRGRRRHRLPGPGRLRDPGPPAPAARSDGQDLQPARPAARPARATPTPSAASRPSGGSRRGPSFPGSGRPASPSTSRSWSSAASWAIASPRSRSSGAT